METDLVFFRKVCDRKDQTHVKMHHNSSESSADLAIEFPQDSMKTSLEFAWLSAVTPFFE